MNLIPYTIQWIWLTIDLIGGVYDSIRSMGILQEITAILLTVQGALRPAGEWKLL